MDRRRFSIAAIGSVVAMAGCDTEQKPAHTATLLNNRVVQLALQELESQIAALEDDVSEFDGSNWRDVVPEVKEGTEAVRSAFEELQKALNVSEEA